MNSLDVVEVDKGLTTSQVPDPRGVRYWRLTVWFVDSGLVRVTTITAVLSVTAVFSTRVTLGPVIGVPGTSLDHVPPALFSAGRGSVGLAPG